ncbi:MAG: hypothetical protein GY874_13040 [Desulfobacteraceae bacterium]|nr:hypothetical protein [Desulfobacteraceae bacterium]
MRPAYSPDTTRSNPALLSIDGFKQNVIFIFFAAEYKKWWYAFDLVSTAAGPAVLPKMIHLRVFPYSGRSWIGAGFVKLPGWGDDLFFS